MEENSIKINTIPITLLKRRKNSNKDIIKQQLKRSEIIRKQTRARRRLIRRPAYFISNARQKYRNTLRLKRVGIQKSPLLINDPKLGIVIRLKKVEEDLPKTCVDVFKILRLDTYNQAVFLKINEPMLELLNLVAPYVAWGYPSLQVIREVISKRGRTMLGCHKHSIDNKIIEEKLSHCGIICLEDIIHELVTLGVNFRAVLQFLCPFKLMPPNKSWLNGSKRCKSRIDSITGFREENINEMIRRMI